MQILGILGIYFDAVVVFVTNFSLLFKLSLAILWGATFNAVVVVGLVSLLLFRLPMTMLWYNH